LHADDFFDFRQPLFRLGNQAIIRMLRLSRLFSLDLELGQGLRIACGRLGLPGNLGSLLFQGRLPFVEPGQLAFDAITFRSQSVYVSPNLDFPDLPIFKLGGVLCARPSTLLAWMAKQEEKASQRTRIS